MPVAKVTGRSWTRSHDRRILASFPRSRIQLHILIWQGRAPARGPLKQRESCESWSDHNIILAIRRLGQFWARKSAHGSISRPGNRSLLIRMALPGASALRYPSDYAMSNCCRSHAAKLATAVGFLAVQLSATGCKPASPSQVPEATAAEKARRFLASRQVVNDNTGFAVDLYHQIRTRQGNLFLSPFSISTALAMTYAGARGDTEREMAEALHFTLPQADLHAVFAHLQAALGKAQRADEVELAVANSLWPRQGLSLRPTFIQLMERDYRTTLTPLDFGQTEPARQTINRWVEEKTRDRIKELIAPGILSPDTVLVLANAIYFNGRWQEPFDPKQTRSAPFHLSATRTVNAPTMHQTGSFGHASVDEVDLLELRYRGGTLSMVVIVPKAIDGLAAVEEGLDGRQARGLDRPDQRPRKSDRGTSQIQDHHGFEPEGTLDRIGHEQRLSTSRLFRHFRERRSEYL